MADLVAERSAPAADVAAPLLRALALSKTYRTPDHLGRLVLERLDFALQHSEQSLIVSAAPSDNVVGSSVAR